MNIRELWGMVPVQTLADKQYQEGQLKVSHPNLLVGLELEIENLPIDSLPFAGVSVTEDGSLRNNGRELITNPMKVKYVERLLRNIFTGCGITQTRNYSDRCSVHVHVNVQDCTIEQLQTILLTYQTVERVLFGWVGEEREGNIYCVPLYQTTITPYFIEKLKKSAGGAIEEGWQKYTALNLLPATQQGTIEFRHLYGTCDVPTIINWINLISSVVEYGKQVSYKELSKNILGMNTVSNYDQFLEAVFGEHTFLLKKDKYRNMLSVGVVDSKLMLQVPKKEAKKTAAALRDSALDELLRNYQEQEEPPPARNTAFVGTNNNRWFIQAGAVAPTEILDDYWVQRNTAVDAAAQRLREAQIRNDRTIVQTLQRERQNLQARPVPPVEAHAPRPRNTRI